MSTVARLYELTDEGRRLAAIGRQIEAQTQAIGRLAAAQVAQVWR
nr:hypothetical protein [Pseudomonas amygdali]